MAKILDKLPSSCILCDYQGIDDKDICKFCFNRLLKNNKGCYQCGTPLYQSMKTNNLCGSCQSTPMPFDFTHVPFIYQGMIRYLITQLKFNQHYKNARLLGQLFAQSLAKTTLPECIIPVPLHKKRYRQRGFNQCSDIAKIVGQQLKIPVETGLCIRHKYTASQVGLTPEKRRKNVKNAFSLIKKTDYTHIAILDDVMTTGSTLQELAMIFKTVGVSTIELWVCARA